MRNRWRLIIALIIILAVSWTDYLLFMEHHVLLKVPDATRKICHLIALLIIFATGIIAWKKISKPIVSLWTISHILLFSILLIVAALDRAFHFGDDFLNEVSRLRMFFCSPMPLAISFVLYKLLNKKVSIPD